MSYSVVNESRKIRKSAYDVLKECQQRIDDKEFLQAKVNFCELLISMVTFMFKTKCKNGSQKTSCLYTLNHLVSIKDTIVTLMNVTGGAAPSLVKWMDAEKAFNKSINVGMIKNFGFVDIQKFLITCQDIFIAKVREMKY